MIDSEGKAAVVHGTGHRPPDRPKRIGWAALLGKGPRMHHVYTLEVEWNGSLLIARGQLGDGWRLMADQQLVKLRTLAVHAGELEDLSAFEVGMFLANACREFTEAWEHARREALGSATLFDELSAEKD